MASDLLNIGTQSVLTSQRQLNTTGHNISNVNTEGYSRQSVIQGVNAPRMYGGQTYGMGVHVENVRRSWDQFAVKELNIATTDYSYKSDTEQNLDMLSKMLSSVASKKIPENMNEWFDALKTLADSPNDMGARKVVLEKSQLMTQNLNDFHETIRRQYETVNKGLDLGIKRINQLALEIRDLQRLMMRTPGPHNDLMDQHEKLVKELSEYTKVTVTPRKNAEGFNIHIGNGHTLVSGTEASQLKMIDGYPDTHQWRLAMVEGKGIKAITSKDMGGKIGALFNMRDNEIPNVLDEIGRLATTFSYDVNKLQSQGLDLNGDIGELMFTDVNDDRIAKERVITSGDSEADMAAYIEDVTQLKGGEYSLLYDGSDYIAILPNGEQRVLSPSGGEIRLDGMRIEIRNEPRSGERVLIRPTRSGAATIKMEMNDPAKIAAQSFEASTTFAQGTATFKILRAGELREFEIDVSELGDTFTVKDKEGNIVAENETYPPSGPFTVMGTTFELSAGALPKDKFTANLVPSEGDNGNLRKMQNIQTDKQLDNNESTILDVYHNLNTNVGLRMSTASRLTDVARLEKEAAQERIASVSGVNLDEEAANMMKFQQAYMASSRIMQTANDTFNTILQLR
ncbi:flagellar hook-associated protein FlgK [Vibrio mangrovi]|uniref:Flagellar hook-associated protein 1 n=1 Tax=Vibrio mangrovi TaxID=474394 RepID=A0A1Y6IWJ4_9VIBR|nr:flagellar hook-associated protein FlgK [Vibrio mangrovi]MDW6001562.1 flagellar hook-associated protein FlgK [Vibrio mangrovi]SMS00413.1 Flagellar hook-associated protein 1 [Vibrio mangrovi]